MRIENRTHWSTRNLKSFVVKVCDREMVTPEYRKRLRVTFNYAKRIGADYWVGGYATYNSHYMTIHLPKDKVHKRGLAHTIAHEMAHNHGVRHRSMHGPLYGYAPGWEELYAWADELPLEKKAPVVPAKPTKLQAAQAKLAGARAALKAWETKKKLAMTKTQKWKDKVYYYTQRVKELSDG